MRSNELVDRSLQVVVQTCIDEFSFDLKELGGLFLVLLPNFPLAVLGSRCEAFLRAHAREICLRLRNREDVLEKARRELGPEVDDRWFNMYFLPQPTCAEVTAAVFMTAGIFDVQSGWTGTSALLLRSLARALLSYLCEFLTEREFEETFPWAGDFGEPDDPVTEQMLTLLRAVGHGVNPMGTSGMYTTYLVLPKEQTESPIGKPPGAREGRWAWLCDEPSRN